MKIRIDDHDLRFRLDNEDLTRLETGADLVRRLATGPGTSLEFVLGTQDGGRWALHHEKNCVRLAVPKLALRDWLASSEIEWAQTLASPNLRVMIEKDLHNSKRRRPFDAPATSST